MPAGTIHLAPAAQRRARDGVGGLPSVIQLLAVLGTALPDAMWQHGTFTSGALPRNTTVSTSLKAPTVSSDRQKNPRCIDRDGEPTTSKSRERLRLAPSARCRDSYTFRRKYRRRGRSRNRCERVRRNRS